MSVACTPALTQDTASHLWMLCKPIPTKVKTGLAGIRGNSVRPRKRAPAEFTRALEKQEHRPLTRQKPGPKKRSEAVTGQAILSFDSF